MKKLIPLAIVLLMLLPLGVSQAQGPAIDSPEDNACNPGGPMAGKCISEWHWVCGYYLARWITNGGYNNPNNSMNSSCLSLLPSREAFFAGVVTLFGPSTHPAFCLGYVGGAYRDELIPAGGPFVTSTQLSTSDGTCSGSPTGTTYIYFYGTRKNAEAQGCIGAETIFNYSPLFAPADMNYCP
jgi:hypothetical protein